MKPLDIEQYRMLVEHTPMMVWRAGRDTKCDYFNGTWLAFTGRALHRELGNGWTEGIHPDDLAQWQALYRDHFERHRRFEAEFRLRRHDGVYRAVVNRAEPYADAGGEFAGFIGSCVDSGQRHDEGSGDAQFFEMSLDHLCVAGLDGHFRRLNPSWSKTLGWTEEELMAKPSIEFVHPDDREVTLAGRAGLGAGAPLLTLVNRYLCKDQTYRWFEWRSVSRVDRGLVYAVARDVTEQKEGQRHLGEVTESLSTILNSLAEGVIAIGGDAAVVRMNPVAEKLTGWNSSDAVGKPLHQVFNVVSAETRLPAVLPVEQTLRQGIASTFLDHTLLIARDATELPISSSCAPMKNADGTVRGAVLVFRDLTAEMEAKEAQKQMQRQLIFVDRMASVGTLAAGVAHEINNPLAYVMANLDMLVEETRVASASASNLPARIADWAEMALQSRQGAERIRKIVRGLKTFSRAEEERRTVIDVTRVLELAVGMVSNEIRHRARLVKDYGETPLVLADDARLGQVFINLLVNASQALPEGQTETNEIRIMTSTDALGRGVIEIRDNGPGIPASLIGRIFDPFFTTKPIGVGTGLGLSICHNIVTSMGGEITVSSREGDGAVFRVVLPAVLDGRIQESAAVAATTSTAPSHRAAILIIDDESAMGAALGHMLRDHDVTVVTTAKDALELLVSNRSFDLVLSDLMMPEMSGMDLYEELVRRGSKTAARMVFITGGAFTQAAKKFLDRVPNARIEKPFGVTTLRQLVRKMVH